jgi:Zn-dependent protease/CBS domain-containing protein
MRTHISLGRIFGIEVGLHYSWFLIALLIVFSLGGYFRSVNPGWSDAVVWSLAALTGLLFFVSVILHELSHSLMAKARNLPVRSITLFALGGVSQIEKSANTAKTEFLVAIVGPLTSLVVGGASLLLAWAAGWQLAGSEPSPVVTMLVWLGYINVALAVFNMIPGFPLDGGRVLRALLWWKSGDGDAATRWAARTGQVVGGLFIAWGLGTFLMRANYGGLWIALIGWFLMQVAAQSYAEVDLRRLLHGVRVADVMARDCPAVDANSSVESFIGETVLHTERRCFVVEMNGEPVGLLGAGDVGAIEPAKRPFTTLDQVMQPLDQTRAVNPDTPLSAALELMARTEARQLAVVSEGHLDGVVSRRQVAQYLSTRAA